MFDLEGAEEYTSRFKRMILKAEAKIQQMRTAGDLMRSYSEFRKCLFIVGVGRIIGQLLACHIIWVNIIIGTALLLGNKVLFQYQLYKEWFSNVFLVRIVEVFLVILIPTILFYFYEKCLKRNDNNENRNTKILKILAGISTITLLILLYTSFNTIDIIYVMIFQQAIISLFLQFATSKKETSKNGKNEHITANKLKGEQ